MIWVIQANVTELCSDRGVATLQVPTFFLDGDIQGIVDANHAEVIARGIINPTGNPKIEVQVYAERAARFNRRS